MIIEIDSQSGFCFGVRRAIDQAEKLLADGQQLFSLGDMVHNHEEVERLEKKGMTSIGHEQLESMKGNTVLIRSHGEPPETFLKAIEVGIQCVDVTCPVVSKLQQRVKKSYQEMKAKGGQLLIYGKKDHPETIGLNGQTGYQAIIITQPSDLDQIDFSRPVEIYSQTTMPVEGFNEITAMIIQRAKSEIIFHDTICRQVANRLPRIREFAKQYDRILFVSGKKSSNGKMLFEESLRYNPNSSFISSTDEIDPQWVTGINSIGICGATSTPLWQLEQVKEHIKQILNIGEEY